MDSTRESLKEGQRMPQKLRKTRKMRGSRTHGYGQIGQHRKGGGKGGGKAGRNKIMRAGKDGWTYAIRHKPNYFGKKGFTSAQSLKHEPRLINVGRLEDLVDRLILEEKMEKRKGTAVLDLTKLGYDKLLGMGNLTKPFIIKIASHSEAAARKVEKAGGQIAE
ncbi:MAG: uL15 family ribosomal protein [Candidatus Bathyarchaeota archaeon]|nr:MAG: uL15 family ribosomal protein [Candidatus Bathyarchaeota archaeon]